LWHCFRRSRRRPRGPPRRLRRHLSAAAMTGAAISPLLARCRGVVGRTYESCRRLLSLSDFASGKPSSVSGTRVRTTDLTEHPNRTRIRENAAETIPTFRPESRANLLYYDFVTFPIHGRTSSNMPIDAAYRAARSGCAARDARGARDTQVLMRNLVHEPQLELCPARRTGLRASASSLLEWYENDGLVRGRQGTAPSTTASTLWHPPCIGGPF
jgi:hypothetical protein